MMIAGSNYYPCPHCGAEKKLIALLSGNSCGATHWSDGYSHYPWLRNLSPVLLCEKCGQFFFTNYSKSRFAEKDYTNDTGHLDAFDSYYAIKALFFGATPDQKEMLCMNFIHQYNEAFMRPDKPFFPPMDEDRARFNEILHLTILLHEEDDLMKAELLREAGDFKQCIVMLDRVGRNRDIAAQIRERAENEDSRVFVLQLPENG